MFELHSYRFEYRVSSENAARSLSRLFARPEWKKVRSDISLQLVKVHKIPAWWWRRSLEPIFVGHFHPKAEGCTLVGRFRMQWDAMILLIAAFAYIGWRILDTTFRPEQREGYVAGWRSAELAVDLKSIAFMLLMVAILWVSGTNARKEIVNALNASVEAE
jgi:hypothetical protein